ncbi:ATP-binding protein [Streptomyces sp. NPDC097617]|uniref:ATP-binding protein n=1 Tax=Streptomyces sp. NPDC097617 TaxID=3366091 RepID=UPI00380C715E
MISTPRAPGEATPATSARPGDGGHQIVDHHQGASGNFRYGSLPRHAAIALPAQQRYVRMARRFAMCLLTRWGMGEDDQTSALLIVGELAANASQHGRSEMTISLCLTGSTLHVDVADFGESSPVPGFHSVQPEDEHGRGLEIVSLLADRAEYDQEPWGWRACASLEITHPQPRTVGITRP